jgi:hypothetical protein
MNKMHQIKENQRKHLSINEQMKLNNESKLNKNNSMPKSQRELANFFNISIGCVNNILNRHNKVKKCYEENDRIHAQLRKTPNEQINELMFDFLKCVD